MLGGRAFCATHFAHVTHERRSATAPLFIEIGALVLFAGAASLLAALPAEAIQGSSHVLIGVLLALVPAAIWLVAFYRQDRLEPEPKRYVLGVFVLAAGLAAAVGQPLLRTVFDVQSWIYDGPVNGILGSVFLIGMLQEFLKYAAVRYTVYNTAEFDERVDGIIYGAAAGLGYATALNLAYVVSHDGVHLGAGAIQVAVTALAHASFSAVVGYFLGRAKFERRSMLWLPAGLLLASVLDGAVSFALREVPMLTGLDYRPWYGLVLAAIVASGTFAAVYALIHRINMATFAAQRG